MKGYSKMKIIHSPSHPRSSMEGTDGHSPSSDHHMNSKKTDQESKKPEQESSKIQETNTNNNNNNDEAIQKKIKNPKKHQEDSFLWSQEDGTEENNAKRRESRKEEAERSSSSPPPSRSNLKRNSSVSSASTSLHSAVKKAFSMRRSTSVSVSDRYCRIHDQASTLPSPTTTHHNGDFNFYDDNLGGADGDGFVNNNKSRSMKKKPTRGRILKACKKLIGM